MALLFLLAIGLRAPAFATQVPETMARTVALHFMSTGVTAFPELQEDALLLVHTVGDPAFGGSGPQVYFRVYNITDQGFVVVAGDDAVLPVLAYSTESAFDPQNMPVNVAKWLEGYRNEIRHAVEAGAVAADEVAAQWQRLLAGESGDERNDRDVLPLLQTNWDQSPHVNALCPGGSVTGCVATAMAQIMKFHNHPAQGSGFHSYGAPNYGTLSANFGATTYNWGAMPNTVNSPNNAVATLMYHCGVSVDMQYSPQISGAWVIEAHSPTTNHNSEHAMKTYFGYHSGMQGLKRENYSQAQWINMLKADLDASRPVLYAGWGSGGGHAFVCDGYDNNDFFHFNWGWGGMANGYFTVNALNPGSTGTGGGTGGYNSGQQALFGIRPATGGGGGGGQPTFNLALYNFVTPSAGTIYYGQSFSVSTNIVNNGSSNFTGDYCAAVFDANSNFYGFVQTLSNYSLAPGNVYLNNLVFSASGLLSMLPGTYYVGVFYRPPNGEWVLVSDSAPYINFAQINVINPNDIELNASMTVSPGTTVTQGGPISVNLNIINTGFSTFFGQYGVGLFNMDGTLAQEIGILNESAGLPYNYTYLAPFLTFGPATVTVPPGTYLLATQHNFNNTGWQLTGSTYFSNPIFVTVVAPALAPDQYEVNNTVAQAYSLPVNFSGNNASVSTTGSNLHNSSDQDFYKVVLPAGYDYTITARLHDAYNSGNGNTYTVDGMFAVSGDGSTWSAGYDDVMPGSITVSNGGTVHFHMVPYFTGGTGTYLLQLDLTRAISTGMDGHAGTAGIGIFPNPACDRLTIDLSAFHGELRNVQVFNMQGQAVLQPTSASRAGGRMDVDLSTLANDIYLLQLTTDQGMRTERIVVAR